MPPNACDFVSLAESISFKVGCTCHYNVTLIMFQRCTFLSHRTVSNWNTSIADRYWHLPSATHCHCSWHHRCRCLDILNCAITPAQSVHYLTYIIFLFFLRMIRLHEQNWAAEHKSTYAHPKLYAFMFLFLRMIRIGLTLLCIISVPPLLRCVRGDDLGKEHWSGWVCVLGILGGDLCLHCSLQHGLFSF